MKCSAVVFKKDGTKIEFVDGSPNVKDHVEPRHQHSSPYIRTITYLNPDHHGFYTKSWQKKIAKCVIENSITIEKTSVDENIFLDLPVKKTSTLINNM